jgi:hypothetical protein
MDLYLGNRPLFQIHMPLIDPVTNDVCTALDGAMADKKKKSKAIPVTGHGGL